MQKRDETLKLVMETIMLIQKDFLISGSENDLKPMKLADVAEIVKMDISTISRVSNSKYVETHFGTFKSKIYFLMHLEKIMERLFLQLKLSVN